MSRQPSSQNGKIELKNFNGINGEEGDEMEKLVDPEEHIHKMTTFKRLFYFKGCKPAKFQLPIGFAVINVIYWMWIVIANFSFPPGFQKLPQK